MSLQLSCMQVEDGLVDSAVPAALFHSRMDPISDKVLRLMRV